MPIIETKTMPQIAEFKVAHLYPPYQGKGLAKIVAHDGTKYSCQESQLSQFQEGEDVAIRFENESFKSKKTGDNVSFKKFISKIAKTNGGGPAKQYTRPAAAPREARQIGIFAAAKLTQPIPLGTVEQMSDALTRVLLAASKAYDRVLASSHTQVADDLNDEIPEGNWAVNSENPAD